MGAITQDEFKILVKAMKAVYPQETFLPDEDAAKVWFGLLKDLDYKTLSHAVQKHMMVSRFPPTIADLREQAVSVGNAVPDDQSELAAWSMVRQAISNSSYHSEEEFARLPPLIQKAVGNPANLREMAGMDMDTVNSVEQSHFIRSYRTMIAREREMQKLSPALRELVEGKRAIGTKSAGLLEGSRE